MNSVFGAIGQLFRGWGSFFKDAIKASATGVLYFFAIGETRRESTEQYPDPISSKTEDDLPPRTRGLLFNDIKQCSGCLQCEEICPTKCIRVQNEPGIDAGKNWVAIYDIDLSKCISCGLCVEVCPTGSLKHTKEFEVAGYFKGQLLLSFGKGHLSQEQRQHWMKLRGTEHQ